MSQKYYQEYGPMRRRRGRGQNQRENQPIEPVTELELDQEYAPPRSLPRPRRKRRARFGLLTMTLLGVALILAAPYAIAYALPLISGTRVPDGISIQGQKVGGLNRDQLRAALEARYAAFQRSPVTLTYEDRTWAPTSRDLGLTLDIDGTVERAMAAGGGTPIERVRSLWSLWRGGLDLAPSIAVDSRKMQAYLMKLSPDLELAPRDAALSLAAGKVIPTAAQIGRQLLVDQTSVDVLRAVQSLTPQPVPVRTRTLSPAIDDQAMAPAVGEAQTLLKTRLTLIEGQRSWDWDEERIASMLNVHAEHGAVTVEVDQERLTRQIEKLAQLVDSGSVEPRVAFRDGKLRIVEEGHTGLRLKQSEAADAIVAALRSDTHSVALPTEVVSPQITQKTLPDLGINELVAEGRSSFAGSAAYRVTNIEAGATRMNGVLIAPGEEFSFNTQLGEVDEANGFVQGYAVIGNRTQLEWGGGVCQVSTTVFRAAFWAGLPFTERHAHPFYISWYDDYSFPNESGPGMDATIFTGVQDLKFVNDTGKWLLMETNVDTDAQVLSIRLYGTRPDRVVNIVGPQIDNVVAPPSDPVYVTDPSLPAGTLKQTDHSRKGMDINVYRVIEQNGKKSAPEQFFTRFKAWPDVFVRGIGSP
jgi:vancomycin resistance protein YoaR